MVSPSRSAFTVTCSPVFSTRTTAPSWSAVTGPDADCTSDEHGRIVRTAEHETRSALLGLRFEAWLGEQSLDAEQARWAGLIGSRIRADAMTIDGFWDYDLDLHPFTGLGGYDQAVRVFGGRDALDLVLGSLNVAVFDDNGPGAPERAGGRPSATEE